MAVIPFPQFQPQGAGETELWKQRTIGTRQRSPVVASSRTLERPGSEWACTPRFNNLDGMKRAVFQQFLANCRGYGSRFYMPTFYRNRGSFPAPELLANNTFANGTTGWSQNGLALSVADGLLRQTRTTHNATTDMVNYGANPITVTQYAPYAARSIDHQGRSTLWSAGPQLGSNPGGEEYGRGNAVGFGLKQLVAVLPAASVYFGLVDYDTGANISGDFIDFSYVSLARCALVDNGPNFFQRSDQIDNAYWTKDQCTASTDGGGAPDGTTDADIVTENTANSQHVVYKVETRVSQVDDWCVYGHFERSTGTRNIRLVIGSDGGSNFCEAIFDLGSGTIAFGPSNTGTVTNGRAFIKSMGGNRYYCAVVARFTATTQVLALFGLANGTTISYTGDGTSGVSFWRCGAAPSSVPTRGMKTTSAGDGDGVAQTGSALYLKGLPASTNGLLLTGDWVEITTGAQSSQPVRVARPLNSDAAGFGYLQFEAPLRTSPADNSGVMVCNPLIRASLDHRDVEWSEHDDGFSSLEFTAVEELA